MAVLSLLAEAAERQPVLCVVDDAHWLDEASANALVFVARRLEAEGVVLLFAARDGDPRRFGAVGLPELELGGLDRVAVAALLAQHAAVLVDPEVRDRLVERTGGNPLALIELPSILTSGQLSGTEPLPLQLPLTDGVERAFLERVRSLSDDAQALLLVAAAEDTGRHATVTAAAATLGAGVAALDAAEAAGLVRVRAGALHFRHPLVRSAVYQGASSSQRQQAHLALAGRPTARATPIDGPGIWRLWRSSRTSAWCASWTRPPSGPRAEAASRRQARPWNARLHSPPTRAREGGGWSRRPSTPGPPASSAGPPGCWRRRGHWQPSRSSAPTSAGCEAGSR